MTQKNPVTPEARFQISIEVSNVGGAIRVEPSTTPYCFDMIKQLHDMCRGFTSNVGVGTYSVAYDGTAFERQNTDLNLQPSMLTKLDEMVRGEYEAISLLIEQLPIALRVMLSQCSCGQCTNRGEMDRIVNQILAKRELYAQLSQIQVRIGESDDFGIAEMFGGTDLFGGFSLPGFLLNSLKGLFDRLKRVEKAPVQELYVDVPEGIFVDGLPFDKEFIADLMRPMIVAILTEAINQRMRGEQIRLITDRESLLPHIAASVSQRDFETDLAHDQFTHDEGFEQRMEDALTADQAEESDTLTNRQEREAKDLPTRQGVELEELTKRHAQELSDQTTEHAQELTDQKAEHAANLQTLPDDIRFAMKSFEETLKGRGEMNAEELRDLENLRVRFNGRVDHFAGLLTSLIEEGVPLSDTVMNEELGHVEPKAEDAPEIEVLPDAVEPEPEPEPEVAEVSVTDDTTDVPASADDDTEEPKKDGTPASEDDGDSTKG